MKTSPVIFLLTLLFYCHPLVAQSRAGISLDLRSDGANSAAFAGSERSRVIKSTNAATMNAAQLEREVFALINAERTKNGLTELEWDENVAAVARLHSQDMAKVKFFSHRGSDGSLVDDRADRLGLGVWSSIGENIAYMRGFDDPAATAVAKWLDSTAHRKNLLNPNWRESAVGVAITADGTYYLTEVFLLRK